MELVNRYYLVQEQMLVPRNKHSKKILKEYIKETCKNKLRLLSSLTLVCPPFLQDPAGSGRTHSPHYVGKEQSTLQLSSKLKKKVF